MEDGKDMEGDERSVAHLLKDQIEFADVILLNKTDLVSKNQLNLLKGMLKGWNATAEIIATKESKVCDLYCTANLSFFKCMQFGVFSRKLQTTSDLLKSVENHTWVTSVYAFQECVVILGIIRLCNTKAFDPLMGIGSLWSTSETATTSLCISQSKIWIRRLILTRTCAILQDFDITDIWS